MKVFEHFFFLFSNEFPVFNEILYTYNELFEQFFATKILNFKKMKLKIQVQIFNALFVIS